MVGNDYINSPRIGMRHLIAIGNAAINRNEKRRASFFAFFNCFLAQPKPLGVAMRYVIFKILVPDFFKKIVEHNRRGKPVGVIIGKNDNPFIA